MTEGEDTGKKHAAGGVKVPEGKEPSSDDRGRSGVSRESWLLRYRQQLSEKKWF
ncbi:MAG: hypothetical protein LUQ12_00830 [Methanoregulaceae archaeon]|nr:hypothetical protein [Methanoregulaceae archaeon]